MKETIRLGLPIGGIVFAEVIIFSVVGLLMAKFPSMTIASHQSAMNFSTLMYAFPASISNTMAIIVSYEIGAGRPDVVRQYCRIGRWTAFGFAFFTLTFLYFYRYQVAGFYGNDPEFIHQTAIFMTYSLPFSNSGYGRSTDSRDSTRLQGYYRSLLARSFSYWCVSIPLGIFFRPMSPT